MKIFQKVILILVLVIFFYFSLFSHCYILSDEGVNYQVVSLTPLSIEEIISSAKVSIRPEDEILPEQSALLTSGIVTIKRSKPVLTEIDGAVNTLYTTAQTVKDFLKEKNISLKEKDYISVALDEDLKSINKITIKQYIEREKIVKEPIQYKTIYEYDNMVAKSLIFKKQEGKNGILEKHFKEIYFGGIKTEEAFMFDKTAKAPINEIYVVGKAQPPSKYVKSFMVVSTAYSPTFAETDGDPWTTASGLESGFGVIAVDPKVIPIGSLVYVDGYGYAVAGDTGGAIKGDKIDVFFYSTRDSVKWGVKKVKIYILEGKWKFPEKSNF